MTWIIFTGYIHVSKKTDLLHCNMCVVAMWLSGKCHCSKWLWILSFYQCELLQMHLFITDVSHFMWHLFTREKKQQILTFTQRILFSGTCKKIRNMTRMVVKKTVLVRVFSIINWTFSTFFRHIFLGQKLISWELKSVLLYPSKVFLWWKIFCMKSANLWKKYRFCQVNLCEILLLSWSCRKKTFEFILANCMKLNRSSRFVKFNFGGW